VNISVPPKITTPPSDIVVEIGGTATFLCDIFGNPRLDFEWFRNGKPLNPLLMPDEDQARITIDGNK
jgi:hypothetical protein